MAYGTKLLVIVSVSAAILLETVLAGRAWPGLITWVIVSFLAAASLSVALGDRSASVVIFFTYLTPALVFVLNGSFNLGYGGPWMAALLGAMLPRSISSPWTIPGRWRAPLILWALVIALTWPVVVFRELDFTPALFNESRLPVSGVGVNPAAAAAWICDVAATLGIGILWFDWLFLSFHQDESRFRRRLLPMLAASWTIAVAAGIYQLFGNILFLNFGLFGGLGRASGTMRDANPFGLVAALGGPSLVAAAALTRWRPMWAFAACGMLATWLGIWASAGRTAFAAGFIASAFLVYASWSASSVRSRLSRRARVTFGIVSVLTVVSLTLVLVLLPVTSGPLPRLRQTLPAWSLPSLIEFGRAMWNRGGYGTVSTLLIRQFPLFGVGVGSFHLLVPDYHFLLTHERVLRGDNAQNWFRHQVVEMGLVGSIGWIWWTGTFAWFVLSTPLPEPTRTAGGIVKGILVALAAVSLVGMPTQNVAAAITFWTLAFWYLLLVGSYDQPKSDGKPPPLGKGTWVAIWTIVVLSVSGTAYTARHELRVPQRAVTVGWPYSYGLPDVDPNADLGRRSSAWAGRHAVAVLAPSTGWVKLTVSVDRLNTAKGPVDVQLWCDNEQILATRVAGSQPTVRYVQMRRGQTRMLLETWVSRSVRLADYGLGDNRERGLLVEWEFVEGPPLGYRPVALSSPAS